MARKSHRKTSRRTSRDEALKPGASRAWADVLVKSPSIAAARWSLPTRSNPNRVLKGPVRFVRTTDFGRSCDYVSRTYQDPTLATAWREFRTAQKSIGVKVYGDHVFLEGVPKMSASQVKACGLKAKPGVSYYGFATGS